MPLVSFSERDLLRNKIVEPAWYRVRIDSVGEKTSSKGTSQFYPMEGTILFNADTGSRAFENCPTPQGWGFSELAWNFAIGFFEAVSGEAVQPNVRYRLEDSVGKEVDIFIGNGTYDGRTVNKINHQYRPARKEETVA